jgi:hypothetical protein
MKTNKKSVPAKRANSTIKRKGSFLKYFLLNDFVLCIKDIPAYFFTKATNASKSVPLFT